MNKLDLPSGLHRGIPFLIPNDWSADQALAVFELLDDLRHQIWAHYQAPIQELLRAQRRSAQRPATHDVNHDDPPF